MTALVDAFADFVGRVSYAEAGAGRVWDLGSGPPVVLLHGIAGSRRPFFRVAPRLAERARVVVPLLRGEERPQPCVSWRELADDLGALLDALELDGVTLAGSSFGGAVALAYAARGDPRIARVVAQGAFAGFSLRPLDRLILGLSRLVPARAGQRYFARRVRRGAENGLVREYAPGLEELVPDWMGKTPFATLRARIRLITNEPLGDEFGSIRAPVTLARGARDKVVPRKFFDQLAALCPNAETVTVEHAGHLMALTHPDEFCELVLRIS